jgi:ABC-2 type transport system permease protein
MTVERVVSESVTTGPGSVDESTARSAVALDLTPAPGGAPAWRCVLAHAAIQTRVQLRNPEQLLVAIVIPLLALVVLSRTALVSGSGPRIDLAVPGVLALAVLSTAFASLSITTGFERSHGVLRRLGATPLSRGGLLGGKALSVLGVVAAQTVVIVAVGLLLGWHPRVGHPVGAAAATLGLLVLGIAALAPSRPRRRSGSRTSVMSCSSASRRCSCPSRTTRTRCGRWPRDCPRVPSPTACAGSGRAGASTRHRS